MRGVLVGLVGLVAAAAGGCGAAVGDDGDQVDGDQVDDQVDGDQVDGAPCGAWWLVDGDGDGYGAGPALWVECGRPVPPGYVERGGDCCDGNRLVHPDQAEWFAALVSGCPVLGDPCDYNCDGVRTNGPDGGCH